MRIFPMVLLALQQPSQGQLSHSPPLQKCRRLLLPFLRLLFNHAMYRRSLLLRTRAHPATLLVSSQPISHLSMDHLFQIHLPLPPMKQLHIILPPLHRQYQQRIPSSRSHHFNHVLIQQFLKMITYNKLFLNHHHGTK